MLSAVTLNPPFLKNYSRQSRSPCVAKSGTIYYAYYLAYAGCALEMGGHKVTHIDSIIDELSIDETLVKICAASPQLVIVDTSTPSILSDISFCAQIREELPDCVICCSGTFPSKNTEEFFKINFKHNSPVDIALLGEYEETALEIANKISTNEDYSEIDGIASLRTKGKEFDFKSDVKINGGPRKTSEETLDSLPFVSEFYLRHFGAEGIKRHFYASINWPYIQVLTSRGCPYKCSFCNIPSIGSYRMRSIQSVINEMKFIQDEMPFVKEVFFEDDTFPINKKRTIELCESFISNGVKITWSCNARVNTPKDVLAIMKKAQCRLTCVGFESPAADSLQEIQKKTSLAQQKNFMDDAKQVGMKVNGCFILGLPGDNEQSIKNTIDYSKKLMPNTAQFYPHMLYPGTASFSWAEENGLVSHKEWDQWLTKQGFHNTPLFTETMSPERLLELADEARISFYTNPRYLWKMFVQSLFSLKEFQRMLIAGRSFFPILGQSFIKRLRLSQR